MSSLTLDHIITVVCKQLQVSPEELPINRERSSKPLTSAKQIITYLAKKNKIASNGELLKALGYSGISTKPLWQNNKVVEDIIEMYPEDNEFRVSLAAIEAGLNIRL